MKLTDDEMAALAISSGHAWEGRLPTVDDSSLESLLVSVERGQVALLARDLVPEEGQAAQAPLAQVRAVAGSSPAVRMYIALEADLTMPIGLLVEVYAVGGGDYLIDVGRSEGLHEVEVVDTAGASAFVGNATGSAFDEGVEVDGAKLVLLVIREDVVIVQVIDRREVESGRAVPNGTSFSIADLEPAPGVDAELVATALG